MDEFYEDLLAYLENVLYVLYAGQGDTLEDNDIDLIKWSLAKTFDCMTLDSIPLEIVYKIKGYGKMSDIKRTPLRSK